MADTSGIAAAVTLGFAPTGSDKLIFTVGQSTYGPDGKPVDSSVKTAGQVVGYLYTLQATNPIEYQKIVNRMASSGLDVSDPETVQKNWEKAVGAASKAYASGYYRLDPFAAIDLIGSKTSQNQQINLTNINNVQKNLTISTSEEAKGALSNASQQLLGRDPTAKEIKLFTNALNSMEKANPSYTTTTGQEVSNPGIPQLANVNGSVAQISTGARNTTSSSTSTGGVSQLASGQFTSDYAKSAKDYAEYQTETTYMDALMKAIQSPVNV
jgi:hypothetical protein